MNIIALRALNEKADKLINFAYDDDEDRESRIGSMARGTRSGAATGAEIGALGGAAYGAWRGPANAAAGVKGVGELRKMGAGVGKMVSENPYARKGAAVYLNTLRAAKGGGWKGRLIGAGLGAATTGLAGAGIGAGIGAINGTFREKRPVSQLSSRHAQLVQLNAKLDEAINFENDNDEDDKKDKKDMKGKKKMTGKNLFISKKKKAC